MKSNTIAIAFLCISLLHFLRNVSALRRSSPELSPDSSFLQVKSTSPPDKQDVTQGSTSKASVASVDPEGLKKAVTAAVLSSQNQALQNGALNPADFTQASAVSNAMSNAVNAMNNSVNPVNPMATVGGMNSFTGVPGMTDNFSQTTSATVQDSSTQENSLDNLNLLLDPSLPKISQADGYIKENMEKAVHSLKKVLEGLTNLATLGKSRDNEPFNVLGEDYTMRSVLDLMNKELRQVESLQKVVFQFNAFALSTFTKTVDDNKKS